MEKDFTPYEQAMALKELGFREECSAYYSNQEELCFKWKTYGNMSTHSLRLIQCPTFSQAFRWFREKYDCHHTIQHNKKYVGIAYSSVVNFSIDEFNTYEESELECLKKLIEMVKK